MPRPPPASAHPTSAHHQSIFRPLTQVKNKQKGITMAKSADIRPVITLRSTAGTGATYTTTKNRRNTPDRLELLKFDPVLRKRVIFKETR